MIAYFLWTTFCGLLGAWIGHSCYDEAFLGAIFGWAFGTVTAVGIALGGADAAADLIGTAIETFADVLDK